MLKEFPRRHGVDYNLLCATKLYILFVDGFIQCAQAMYDHFVSMLAK